MLPVASEILSINAPAKGTSATGGVKSDCSKASPFADMLDSQQAQAALASSPAQEPALAAKISSGKPLLAELIGDDIVAPVVPATPADASVAPAQPATANALTKAIAKLETNLAQEKSQAAPSVEDAPAKPKKAGNEQAAQNGDSGKATEVAMANTATAPTPVAASVPAATPAPVAAAVPTAALPVTTPAIATPPASAPNTAEAAAATQIVTAVPTQAAASPSAPVLQPTAPSTKLRAQAATVTNDAEPTTFDEALNPAETLDGPVADLAAVADATSDKSKTENKTDKLLPDVSASDDVAATTAPAANATKPPAVDAKAKPATSATANQTIAPAKSDADDPAKPAAPRHDADPQPTAATKPADTLAPPTPATSGNPNIGKANATSAQATATALPVNGIAVEIVAKSQAGKKSFEIRLDPPELGRIHVRLDVDSSGQVSSRLIADRSDTLDLLRRDSASLERALNDAGLKTASNGMQFSLRDQGFGRNDQPLPIANTARIVVRDDTLAAEPIAYRTPATRGGLDIRV